MRQDFHQNGEIKPITMIIVWRIQMMCFLLMLHAVDTNLMVIQSRQCIGIYNEDKLSFKEELSSYKEAVKYCSVIYGELPSPAQPSWKKLLPQINKLITESAHDEGIWTRITVKKDKSGTIVLDGEITQLDTEQIKSIALNLTNPAVQSLKMNEKLCVTYRKISSESDLKFQLQDCEDAIATTICLCKTDIHDITVATNTESRETKNDPVYAAQEADLTLNGSDLRPRAAVPGPGNENAGVNVGGNKEENKSTVNTLGMLLGAVLAVCVVASIYFLAKRHGRHMRDTISQRMPYNRSRTSQNGSSYRQGRSNSQETATEHRPIHVYEEIHMRNSAAIAESRSIALLNGTDFGTGTLPHLPPPEPPLNQFNFVPFHEIRRPSISNGTGYLQPSFRRTDTIPGDVRSPPPQDVTVFKFPSTSESRSTDNLLQTPNVKELKYASVETVQTLLDGETERDEEYLVEDEGDDGQDETVSDLKGSPTFLKSIQENTESPSVRESNRNSVVNTYVDVNDLSPLASTAVISNGEYENERFLRTVMKVPPKKPKRTMKHKLENKKEIPIPSSENTVTKGEDDELPIYSKIKRKKEDTDSDEGDQESCEAENGTDIGTAIGYTHMQNTLPRVSNSTTVAPSDNIEVATYADIPEIIIEPALRHEYEQVTPRSNLISRPTMVSTTNSALNESSLVIYEIPPEEYN